MKIGAPWSVKGIEPQARETAKSAARRAGMTLGEWLNQVIIETGTDASPAADPMRAPEDWMIETGQELPWTRPIEDMSARVSARLAVSEAENAALLGSIETAIGDISKRLIALDTAGPSSPGTDLEARLLRIEAVQKRALSKDNLKTLETAVGQISTVLDNQSERQEGAIRDQGERIDRSQQALVELAAHLEQTEDRVGQALHAVEAASELYEITDKQGQMIDSLVMDIAGVHAEQAELKDSGTHSIAQISGLANDLENLKGRFNTLEGEAAKAAAIQREPEAPGDHAEEAKWAAAAISEQISAHEEKTAAAVSQIESRIADLSKILDQSLKANHSGIEDLCSSFDAVLKRVETLEAMQGHEQPIISPVADQPAVTAQDKPASPFTFKTLAQQTSRNVNLKLAVTIDEEFIRKEEEPAAPDLDELPPVIPEDAGPVLPGAGHDDSLEEPLEQDLEEQDPEPPKAVETQDGDQDNEEALLHIVEPTDLSTDAPGEESARSETLPEIEISAETEADWQDQVEGAISDHMKADETLEDEPLTFADIFGPGEAAESDEPAAGPTDPSSGKRPVDPEEEAALREAVTNISSIRASWAAKSEAEGRPGSMRQIVDVDDEDASKRGWALAASGVIVGLIAISGVLVYSGETNDLIDASQRPGLFDQITSWLPGRSPGPLQGDPGLDSDAPPGTSLASGPLLSGELRTLLATLPPGLEEAAKSGDARAQFALGRAFANGDGRPVDRAAALDWYRASAGQGLAIAQYVLGSLHERGIDVAEDKQVAIDWYASAARSGNRRSMHNLAVAYARGDVIDQDLTQAAYWFSEAAQLGLSDAQYNIALLYERGLGIDKDTRMAWQWYTIAAAGGDKAASTQAKRLGENLSAAQTKAANDFVATWQPQAMEPVANGLFDVSPQAWDKGQQRTDLAIVQSHLMTLGYTLESFDGIMDPATRNAITDFQTSNNLEVTGTMTPGLYEILTDPELPESTRD